MTSAFTPYSTIAPWLGVLPGWVPAEDQQRIAAYQKYEEIYWSSEEGFEEVMRGDNENPVFMPTARTLINTVNRYTAPDFGWRFEAPEGVSEEVIAIAQLAFDNLFTRERFRSKFNAQKRKGLYRGDWLWHVIADDTKPLGRRLRIMAVDPAAYFPVTAEDDPDKIIKVHLAEVINVDNQERVSRLTYERLFDADGNQTGIQVSHGIFKLDDWAKGDSKAERTVIAPTLLDERIPAIPVYHLKNWDDTVPFGSSELRGLESVLLGINQTTSDEDMSLALDGIGIYATDGGAPVDENGNEVDWVMGPGRFLTNANGLKRINGVGTVTPFGDHYNRLFDAVRTAVGAADVAIGKAEAATAESGVALLLQLGPILSYTAEKDQHITDVHSQLFHDLCYWLTIYEELPLLMGGEEGEVPAVTVIPTIGQKIPVNRKQIIDEVIQLRSLPIPVISLPTAHKMLAQAGLQVETNELALIQQEQEGLMANLTGEVDDAEAEARRAAEEQGVNA